jgi:hypothetical protein
MSGGGKGKNYRNVFVLLAGTKFFYSLSIQTGSRSYPSSYSIGTGNTFPVGKARVQLGSES